MGKRRGRHWSDDLTCDERPVRWPDEYCERCYAPDCKFSGLTVEECPFHRRMVAKEKIQKSKGERT